MQPRSTLASLFLAAVIALTGAADGYSFNQKGGKGDRGDKKGDKMEGQGFVGKKGEGPDKREGGSLDKKGDAKERDKKDPAGKTEPTAKKGEAMAAGKKAERNTEAKTARKPGAEQQANLDKLKSDMSAIHGKGEVTPEQAVSDDLKKIRSGANKPSEQSVQKLSADLTKALQHKNITTAEAVQLSKSVSAVIDSANNSEADAIQLMADVKPLLNATNLTKTDVQTIQAIVATARANANKSPP